VRMGLGGRSGGFGGMRGGFGRGGGKLGMEVRRWRGLCSRSLEG
jgi:hypothetical protein